ncbi:MaoC family dehydratase [Trueperella pecoris]|uniref:MaoC-like domain-containing protein n=1 Tax=Trueperella pecoris TaxID=2733571 RepID=A0A7M1QYH2_9ACTO|nr:MaoC/PaaZ C-terminal domain-containing protein [Trueperella pecoris]QOR46237.1 hypothetical protein INS88_03255 [Trueperella pecoris]
MSSRFTRPLAGGQYGEVLMSVMQALVKRAVRGTMRRDPLVAEAVFDEATAWQYATFVDGRPLGHVPPMAFHNMCFPATLRILSEPAVPTRVLGLVHQSLAWELLCPLEVGQAAQVRSLITAVDSNGGSLTIDVTSVVATRGVLHYAERARYVSKRPLRDLAVTTPHPDLPPGWLPPQVPDLRAEHGLNRVGALDVGQRRAAGSLTLDSAAGRRWARISGDANPIHLTRLTAAPFGYSAPIAHGSALEAWAHACVGVNGSSAASGASRFRAPTKLPNAVELVGLGSSTFALLEQRSGRDLVHLAIDCGGATVGGGIAAVSGTATVGGAKAGGEVKAAGAAGGTRILLPRIDGRVSSAALGREAFLAAAQGHSATLDAINSVTNWRKGYREAVREVSIIDDPARGWAAARQGLAYLEHAVTNADGTPLGDLEPVVPSEGTRVKGQGPLLRGVELSVGGETYSGERLSRLLDEWSADGTISPAAASRIRDVDAHPDWLDLRDLTFALLGAGAEMAPTRFLLSHGANVAAVIRPGSRRYARLLDDASRLAGELHLCPPEACDLVQDPSRVAGWVLESRPDVVVETLYAPGKDFLTLELGADVVMRLAAEHTGALLAWYGSPTDAYPVGVDRQRTGAIAYRPKKRYTRRATPAIRDGVFNGIIDLQGPNYILAKRIGRWRATDLAARGHRVSYAVAPMAETESVLTSGTLKAAYRGMRRMGIRPLPADTAAALMATLLVWQVRNGGAASADFLTEAAVPSGLWSQDAEPQALAKKAVVLGIDAFLR